MGTWAWGGSSRWGVLVDTAGMPTFTEEQFMGMVVLIFSALGVLTMLRVLSIFRYKEIVPWDLAREANAIRQRYMDERRHQEARR